VSPKGKSPRFSGELNKPIIKSRAISQFLSANPDLSDEDRSHLEQSDETRILSIQFGKLELLLDHYEIDRSDKDKWRKLGWSLACEFVPGLRVNEPPSRHRGRPKIWQGEKGISLVLLVDQIRAERKRGTADAIRTMIQRYPKEWGAFKRKEEILAVRYAEVKRWLEPPMDESVLRLLKWIGVD
jgi:hypothetical protein